MATIRLEGATDAAACDAIVAAAFGPGRYANTAYRLREGVACVAALSFLAEEDGRIVGTVRYCQNEDCDYKMAVETNDVTSADKSENAVPA